MELGLFSIRYAGLWGQAALDRCAAAYIDGMRAPGCSGGYRGVCRLRHRSAMPQAANPDTTPRTG